MANEERSRSPHSLPGGSEPPTNAAQTKAEAPSSRGTGRAQPPPKAPQPQSKMEGATPPQPELHPAR